MGTCTSCVQTQQHPGASLQTSSSADDNAHSLRRNPLNNRFRSIRTFHSYNLNTLIDETLSIIRIVVDSDQEPPHAMVLVSRIANREDRWLDVMMALIERVPINDPLGATVISLLLDECSLPPKELLQQLIRRVCVDNRSRVSLLQSIIDDYIRENSQQLQKSYLTTNKSTNKDAINEVQEITQIILKLPGESVAEHEQERLNKASSVSNGRSSKRSSSVTKTSHASYAQKAEALHHERNTLIILGCLAEKLVGPTSTSLLKSSVLEFIIDRVYLGIYHYNESTAMDFDDNNCTSNYASVLKIILFALVAVEKFSHSLESKHILLQSLTIQNQQTKMNVLEYYEPWALAKNCLKRQIGFFAQWLLDNVFILDYRRPTYEVIDHHYINVMLNDKDVSEYLKIGPDGLEARSDAVSFESVRSTFQVSSGVWYYEVLIITDGVMQIGWATKQSKFMNHEGYGIGDDQHSIAYDGCRNLIWYSAKSMPHDNPIWKPGDIVGSLIDMDRREVVFSLNGRCLEPSKKLFSSVSGPITDGYFAAASFMSYQQCRFNFGSVPFRYPPTTVTPFKTFNEYGHLSDEEKLILPKYKKLELLRSVKISDQDCILCVDDRANIILKPCGHTGFCEQCALKLDVCPICRADVQERLPITD